MIRRLGVLPLVAFFAASVAAQQPAAAPAAAPAAPAAPKTPECPIDMNTPTQVAIANLQRAQIINARTDSAAGKALRAAVQGLTDSRAASNPLGRDYAFAQILVLATDHGGDIRTRGAIGLPGGNKDEMVDMLKMIDSLLTIIEKGNPACIPEAAEYRQYHPYSNAVTGAYKALAANQFGAADSLARRALILYRDGVQPYDVLWRTAKARGDGDQAIKYLQITADKLAADTLNATVRANLLFNIGRVNQEFADKATDPAKKAQYERAAAKGYLAQVIEYPASEESSFSLAGIGLAATAVKDESLNMEALKVIKASPDKYDEVTLAQAGVIATRANLTLDAEKLFEAASKRNPYSRDYLYNQAAMLYEAKRPAEMILVVGRLLQVDPSNPDNVMLYAYAYNGLSQAEKDPVKKKALLDSMVLYNKASDEMPQKVSFAELTRLRDKTTLKGEVENRTKTARTFTIDFEFLDKTGAVVGGKQTTVVGPIAGGATKSFLVEVPVGGVFGVRYAPLPVK